MTRSKLTKKRARLLAELEHLVGKNCYNGNIQNWGPGGVYEGKGRDFRYPLTMIDESGEKRRRKYPAATDVSPQMLATGYYAFGANRLHIIEALDDVLRHLETHHGLKL
ncbi:hypothetical protein [Pseudothioclava arenosa]|uniref:Uncharacterized protein n=1 Tax=Pseudothioclava arenosa TaxID=1795308 RepID=A0A2A4CUH6_9RHOB|nr:hypothetical protein [Pseudothioclava arenosa]PCD77938.1 hypothetical protein CLN94_01090 [Pseudothioclava arenosa]